MSLLNATGQNTLQTNQQAPEQLHAPISTPIDKSLACFQHGVGKQKRDTTVYLRPSNMPTGEEFFFSFHEQCGTVLV